MEELTIRQISEELGCSKQNISYHLKKLTEGLSERERESIVFQNGRKTMVTAYGFELIKERIANKDKNLSINNKETSYLTNKGQKNTDEYYKKMLSDKDLEIERLKDELKEERRQIQIERERYHSDIERGRQELLNLQHSQKEHTENLLSLFSQAHERQQDMIENFFEKTTRLVSEQQNIVAELTKTTQKLQENQQQLALIDKQPNNFELTSLKERLNDLENNWGYSDFKVPAWTNTVLSIKALWYVIRGE